MSWHYFMSWHVRELADWSCAQVFEMIRQRGDQHQWVASNDGFYLTRGHHSNTSFATLHDYATGNIAWFQHHTKRGSGHNWEVTSGGSESDMFDSILREVWQSGFVVKEMVTDKVFSVNVIYCQHPPEGTITFGSKHSAKTFHKDLERVKQTKCEVRMYMYGSYLYM